MASDRQIAANRANALRSTGPLTSRGKTKASGNAVRHGLLAERPVLPEVETEEEWNEHVARVFEAAQPCGQLEIVLTERIAMQLWRLARAARFEQAVTSAQLLDDDVTIRRLKTEVANATLSLAEARRDASLYLTWRGLRPQDPIGAFLARKVIQRIGQCVGINVVERSEFFEKHDPSRYMWTAEQLWNTAADLAKISGTDVPRVLEASVKMAEAELETAQNRLDRRRRECVLPAPAQLRTLQRYEVTIERSLFRNLHELRRTQADRLNPSSCFGANPDLNLR